jgi:acetylornithine deacetylase/succinyl-diaminopimelate desuccinylase-like protein
MTTTRFSPDLDWTTAQAETVRHLQRLIQFETVNPPGNELPLARYLESVLAKEGIETQLFEPASSRAALVARVRGGTARKPVLLLAHMDVVAVEPDHWSVEPFAGVVKDGYLYGRGAIDDKGMLAANLMVVILLARAVRAGEITPQRDVIFVATSDEETSGDWGLGWLLANHPELVRAEFAINEGGRTRIVQGRPLYLAVQCAEKVAHTVNIVAHGPSGHASIPLDGNAVARLGRALAAIHRAPLPVRLLPTTREFFHELSRVWPEAIERAAMADIASREPARVKHGARILRSLPALDATLRTGISPTIVHGGVAANVIPAEATATLNIRTLPGHSIDRVTAQLEKRIADPLVDVVLVHRGEESPASDFESPMFTAIAESARELNPELAVVPYLGTGATESAHLRRFGVETYGVLPFPMDLEDEERMHGHDERIPLASLAFGVKLLYGAVLRVTR